MRQGCHFIIYGRMISVLVRIFFGMCVQCYIVNNKVFELLKYLFITAITSLGIETTMIKVQILLWFFSCEFLNTRNIPLLNP